MTRTGNDSRHEINRVEIAFLLALIAVVVITVITLLLPHKSANPRSESNLHAIARITHSIETAHGNVAKLNILAKEGCRVQKAMLGHSQTDTVAARWQWLAATYSALYSEMRPPPQAASTMEKQQQSQHFCLGGAG